MKTSEPPLNKPRLRRRVTCPHCWTQFPPEEVHWVAASPELLGDRRLGADVSQRFLPSRFSVKGSAIDVQGAECEELACPSCHLPIARPCLTQRPLFVSIAGTPSCGKSYFLASMTWQLRQSMPRDFDCVFQDADPVSNRLLNDYEEQQFLNANQEQVVRLAKTEEFGDLYSSVQFDNHVVTLPKPFLFSVRPGQNHAAKKLNPEPARLVCLYDNAGESFEAGKDSLENPVTRHLGHAQTLIFCYDPTQDPRVRAACTDQSSDPQVTEGTVTSRQENVLHEIAARLRKLSSLPEGSQAKISVIVACTKYDAWSQLLGPTRLAAPFRRIPDRHSQALDLPRVHEVSAQLRELLAKFTPELVQSAESLSVDVLYVPVSATGASPRKDPESGVFGVRPKDIDPMWCDVPLLTSLAKHGGGLVPFLKAKKK